MQEKSKDILNFDIDKVNIELNMVIAKKSELYKNLENKVSNIEKSISDKICKDNDTLFASLLIIHFHDDGVAFEISNGIHFNHNTNFKILFAKKMDIRFNKDTYILANNIDVYDAYKLQAPGITLDLMREHDNLDLVDFVDFMKYLTVQFQERGDLIQMIKNYYKEYYSDLDVINSLHTKHVELDTQIKQYYIALYKKELTDKEIIKNGNIIVVHNKKKDFVIFDSYCIEKVTNIKIKFFSTQSLKIDCQYYPNLVRDNKKFFLKIRNNDYITNTKDDFLSVLISHKMNGDKIELYTEQEYVDYLMLIQTESQNIKSINDDHYSKISKQYEELFHKGSV